MNSLCGTPYKLNLKLKKLNRNLTSNTELNRLYNNINASIPLITSHFCYLKNRINSINKSLNNIPIACKMLDTSRVNCHSNITNLFTSKNNPNYYNDYYTSPKPVSKYIKINKNFFNDKYGKKYNDKNIKRDNQFKLNYNYRSNYKSNCDKPIKLKHNRNRSCLNMINNNTNFYNKSNINNDMPLGYNNNNKSICNNFNEKYKDKYENLSQQICEKDKIIGRMQGIINDTFNQLNRKKKENSMLQSEIIELKSRCNDSNFYDFKNYSICENSKQYYANNKIDIPDMNINVNKKRNYLSYDFARSHNNNDPDKISMDMKWEEIRKLNRRMDKLLYENENSSKRYKNICQNNYNFNYN